MVPLVSDNTFIKVSWVNNGYYSVSWKQVDMTKNTNGKWDDFAHCNLGFLAVYKRTCKRRNPPPTAVAAIFPTLWKR